MLGIERFEEDADVISLAGDQRMHFLRSFQNGERAKLSQQLLNEVAAARVCLLDKAKKTEYDETLRKKLADKKQAADPPSQDIAATLEFTTPDSTVDWPAGAAVESQENNLWNAKHESPDSVKLSPSSKLTRKTKTRVLIVSLLSGMALLLLLGVVLAGFHESKEGTAKGDRQRAVVEKPSTPSSDSDADTSASDNSLTDKEATQVAADAEAERQAAKKAEREAKEEADRKLKEETARIAKEEAESERIAKETAEAKRAEQKARREKILRLMETLQQRVDQSIQKAERMQYSPDQALDVIRDSLAEVERAEVPLRLKRSLRQKLKEVGSEVSRRAAAQREKQAAEEKAAWRKEHPEAFLEKMGLVKQKDIWALGAAIEISDLNKPIVKLISRYNRQASDLKTKEARISKQENRILGGMQKLPGVFQVPKFQQWILDGMREDPDAPRSVRMLIDKAREEYERFRERSPRIENELQQKVGQLQAMKMKYQSDVEALDETVNEISDIDQAAERLMRDIEQAEENLNRENADVQAALISSGTKYDPPDITSTQKLLKKVGEILEDDLVDALRDQRDSEFQN